VSAKLADVTRSLRDRGEKAVVAFLTAGYPDERTFVDVALAASRAGCDAIEIGVPFSDPIADGPVIQASSEASLSGGMTLARALELGGEIAGRVDTPLVVMSYLNPILNMGLEKFAATAVGSGISGVILPDVSLEESADIRRIVRGGGLDYIDLVAPTSSAERVRRIAAAAAGNGAGGGQSAFLYLVSVTGVTGTRSATASDLEPFVSRVRRETGLPLYVGFGVSTADQAREVARLADGVIIGSQLIRLSDEGRTAGNAGERVGAFLSGIKETISC
jgi:tryptophan synthase alpha chain